MSFVFRIVFLISVGPGVLFGQALADDEVWLDALLGEDEGEPVDRFEEESELLASFVALSGWSRDLTVTLGTGWRENALLESAGGVDASYSQLEVDFFALRPGSESGAEILAMVYGDYRYFYGARGMDIESLTIAQGAATWRRGMRWELGVLFEGMHSVQAFDASEAEFETAAATVSVWQPEAGLKLAGEFGEWGSFEWKSKYGLVSYDQRGEDYERWTNALLWKKDFGERSRLRVGLDWYLEDYDERLERMSRSVLQDACRLLLDGFRCKAVWSRDFEKGFWRGIRTSVSFEQEHGAVGDYFDSERFMGRQSLEFALLGWKGFLSATYGETEYTDRLALAGSEVTRSDRSWRWSFEGARPLGKRFECLVRWEGTEKESNAVGLSYDGGGISVGFRVNDLGGF